jgi:nicotinate-nucleotide adenylyltransferase
MEFLHRTRPLSTDGRLRVGILPGAFNPPTVAHCAIAGSALKHVDEVVFVLPRAFPHKVYEGAPFEIRVKMLRAIASQDPAFSIAVAEGGLFRSIAAEFREVYGPGARFSFLCGRDAAERILHWDYRGETTAEEMLREFDLLVAARRGEIEAPLHLRHAIERLYLSDDHDAVSSTEVRQRIERGEPWRHLVPEEARELAEEFYSKSK